MIKRHCIATLTVFFIVLVLAINSAWSASVTRVQAGIYGMDDLVMENNFLKVTVAPYSGGKIKSFIYKKLNAEGTAWDDGKAGMLFDISPSAPHPGVLSTKVYQYSIAAQTGKKVTVDLWCDAASNLQYRKTISLSDDEAFIEVNLACENIGYTTQTVDWRIQNFIQALTKGDTSIQYLLPRSDGIQNCTDGKFIKDMVDGWFAAINKNHQGMTCAFNYDQSAQSYIWISEDRTKATFEWFSDSFKLAPGGIWQSQMLFAPFDQIDQVKSVNKLGVFNSAVHGNEITLKAFGLADNQVTVALTVSEAKTGKILAERKSGMKLNTAKISELSWNVPELAANQAKISYKLIGNKTESEWFDANSSAVNLNTALRKKNPPELSKKAQERMDISASQDASRTKKIKVLQLSQFMSLKRPQGAMGAEDSLPRVLFRSCEGMQYFLKDDLRFEIDNATEKNWLKKLAKLYNYDVLVINDFVGMALEPYVQDLLKYVQKGHGLIILGGYNAFGSRDKDYSNYKNLSNLLPVEILSTPDWMPQTPIDNATINRVQHAYNKSGISCICAVCKSPDMKIGLSPDAYPIQPNHDFSWIGQGVAINPAGVNQVVAGVPFNTLASGFHKVKAKSGTQVFAKIGQNPVLVGMDYGKGRILASAISDYQRLYFWPHTAQFYGQLLEWAARKEAPVWLSGKAGNQEIEFTVHNNSDKTIEDTLQIKAQAPDNVITQLPSQPVSVKPGQQETVKVSVKKITGMTGRHKVSAELGKKTMVAYVSTSASPADTVIDVGFKHKRRFVRGEIISPEITLVNKNSQNGKVDITCRMVDQNGQEVFIVRKNNVTLNQSFKIPVNTGNLAYGEYQYTVEADGIRSANWLYVGKVSKVDFPVGWWGTPSHGSDYMTIAGLDLLAGRGNISFGPKIYKEHFLDAADYQVQTGLRQIVFAANMARTRGDGGPVASPNHPVNAAAQDRNLKKTLDALKDFPAISAIYLDDEAFSIGRSDFDTEEFRKMFNRDFPCLPKTAEEKKQNQDFEKQILPGSLAARIMLADYQVDSLAKCYQRGAAIVHAYRPDWQAVMLTTFGVTPVSGNWIEKTFAGMDAIMIDVYPNTVHDIGESLFYMNLMRSSAERQHKPAWIVLGEFRNDFESCKMQFWLTLMTNMKGYFWFSLGGSWGNGMRSEKFKQLEPYDKFATEYGRLFYAWSRPKHKIAVLYSKAVLAKLNREPYESIMEKTFEKLYSKDIVPDVVTEEQIRDGSIANYDMIVLSGVDELEQDVIDKLSTFAQKHQLYVDDKTSISVGNSKPFNLKEISAQIIPEVITPDERVYGELCTAGNDVNYVVLYNHSPNDNKKAKIELPNQKGAIVYDIRTHEQIPVVQKGNGIEIELPISAYNGRVLALMRSDIQGPKLTLSNDQLKAGETLEINLSSPVAGIIPVKLEIIDPNKKVTRYSENFVMQNDRHSLKIPLAINDLKGSWMAAATEMISGKKNQAAFTIK